MNKTTRADRILLISVLLIAAILFAIFRFSSAKGKDTAVISVDGSVAYRLPLDTDTTITIDEDGRHNVITVKDAKVWMSEANCPDQICVHQGAAYPGGPIACLPNRVLIELSQSDPQADTGQPDAVIH